jgi:hypothetical protein
VMQGGLGVQRHTYPERRTASTNQFAAPRARTRTSAWNLPPPVYRHPRAGAGRGRRRARTRPSSLRTARAPHARTRTGDPCVGAPHEHVADIAAWQQTHPTYRPIAVGRRARRLTANTRPSTGRAVAALADGRDRVARGPRDPPARPRAAWPTWGPRRSSGPPDRTSGSGRGRGCRYPSATGRRRPLQRRGCPSPGKGLERSRTPRPPRTPCHEPRP